MLRLAAPAQINHSCAPLHTSSNTPGAAQNEPYLRREWRMAFTESDCSFGQSVAWACHRRRESRHGHVLECSNAACTWTWTGARTSGNRPRSPRPKSASSSTERRAVSAANALLDPSARNAHNGLPDLPAGDQLRGPGRLAAFGFVVLIPAARCPGHHLLRAGSGRDSLLTAGTRPARSNSKAYKAEVEISDHCAQSCTSASLSILGTP
jgi:hypothetical protein